MDYISHTHTQPFYVPLGFCPGLPRWAGTRKVKPVWIYWSKRVSGSGISWAICKSVPWPRHMTTPASHHFFTGQMPFLLPNQQRQSTGWHISEKFIKVWKAVLSVSTLLEVCCLLNEQFLCMCMQVYSEVYWLGHVLFVIMWPIVYAVLPKSQHKDANSSIVHPNTHK